MKSRVLGAGLAVLLLAGACLVALGLWVRAGAGQDAALSIPQTFDPTPFRVYEAVDPESPLRLKHFISEANEVNVSSSLIMGERELVVVTTQATKLAAERLADAIEATGLELTFVYLTHAHLDHSQGASVLAQRFPNARFVAEPRVSRLQQHRMAADDERAIARFGDNAAVPSVPFEPLDADRILLEGHEILLWHGQYGDVGVGHEDEPHTVVYVPALKALLPSDICYFGAHVMMGGGTPESRAKWKEQLRAYMEMDLQVVIPGHVPRSKSGEMTADGVLEHSLRYIEDYERALETYATSDEVIAAMLRDYPELEHESALYLGTYINFRETHRLLFNPRLEWVASYLPGGLVRWVDERLFESAQESANP